MQHEPWIWAVLAALGAFHGINPAMGWLFAVALGLQQKDRSAVFRALPAIALGHALSITIIVGIVLLARINLSHIALKFTAAAILFTFGFLRLWRPRHPKWVGMQVGFRDLKLPVPPKAKDDGSREKTTRSFRPFACSLRMA